MNSMTRAKDCPAHGSRLVSIRPIFILLMLWVLLHTGCASWPGPTRSLHVGTTGPMGVCADFFGLLDAQTATSDAFDSGYARVKQYPYLRADRFIASFRNEVEDKLAFAAWVDHMQALDRSARQFEIANLSDADIAAMDGVNGRDELTLKVDACGDLLKGWDFLGARSQAKLRRAVSAQDDYIPLRRFLGLYPLTSLFVSRGVSKWHAEAREDFTLEPPTGWQPGRYLPAVKPDLAAVHRIMQGVARDALGIPTYTAEDRRTLLQMYAPIWDIQIQGENDRMGSPIWTDAGRIDVDTDRPQTYTLISLTRFGKEILTQLNYIIWFPSRPKARVLDIYGGLLDGINFRVTLDSNGDPILYETIHNCGCYYKAYPTTRLQVRESITYAEPPLILKAPDINPASEWLAVAVESRTHYVGHLYPVSRAHRSTTMAYTLADYGELKRLPHLNGHPKSMFNRYGIVPGSERLERFILWPTGVLSPGAMRQWGRHAVAFVGKRHFDDPFDVDKMFTPAASP